MIPSRNDTRRRARLAGALVLLLTIPTLHVATATQDPQQWPDDTKDPIGDVVVFDVATRTERRFPAQPFPEQESWRATPEFAGVDLPDQQTAAGDELTAQGVTSPDDRKRVSPTTPYPSRTVVKLLVDTWNGSRAECSGAMVDAFHVLTAAHCIHDGPGTGWAREVLVIPAMDDGWNAGDMYREPMAQAPYGYAESTRLRSYSGWTDGRSRSHDWALITLDRPIGDYTGWMGRATAGITHGVYFAVADHAGYPGDRGGARFMYWDEDRGCGATTNRHYTNVDTWAGQSGGPVWRYDGSSRYILATMSHGANVSCVSVGTRLNSDKFDRLNAWLDQDSTPGARADLTERVGRAHKPAASLYDQPYSKVMNVYAGPENPFWVEIQVRNYGYVPSGSFDVTFYASRDKSIGAGDHVIGTVRAGSIGRLSNDVVRWSGDWPSSIPAGFSYYVGWRIDSGNDVREYTGADNTGYLATPVFVDATAPTGSISVPRVASGSYAVTWSAMDNGGSTLYRVLVERGAGSSWSVVCYMTASGTSDSGSCTPGAHVGRACYRLSVYDRAGNAFSTAGTDCTLGTVRIPVVPPLVVP